MTGVQGDTSMADVVNTSGDMTNHDMVSAMDLSLYPSDMRMDTGGDDLISNSVEPASEFKPPPNLRNDSNESQHTVMSGAGAGPLPTDFGAQSSRDGSGNSTLTEFTKRRNWSQRVLEELRDFLHILTPDGRILYVSSSAKVLTGYEAEDLVGKFIVDFIHTDDSSVFIREFNESIATGNPLRFYYRFRKSDQSYTIFESHGHPHLTSEAAAFGPNNAASFCRGFFMMSRPYPTKNAELLDSFLEHKIEKERLQSRIATLHREEQEEAEANAQKRANGQPESVTATATATVTESFLEQANRTPTHGSSTSPSRGNFASNSTMPPPAKPTISNTALTREALDEANSFSRPDSITDKMARYEGSSHVDGIEMLTGLRYGAGERSHGISTGAQSPTLIRGDAGIPMSADYSRHGTAGSGTVGHAGGPSSSLGGGEKKPSKKMKAVDEYVCTDCGTLDSPEWRKGPSGPKTLCNACGLRWAKKEKKRMGKEGGDVAKREGTQEAGMHEAVMHEGGMVAINQNRSNSGSG